MKSEPFTKDQMEESFYNDEMASSYNRGSQELYINAQEMEKKEGSRRPSVQTKTEKDEASGITTQYTFTNRPKIVLECISARTALTILLTTWLSGIACFSLDSYLTYKSYDGGKTYDFDVNRCDALHNSSSFGASMTSRGCMGDNVTWYGLYTNLENILSSSASLVSKQKSFDTPPSQNVFYDLRLMACNMPHGCGTIGGTSSSGWHRVLEVQSVEQWYLVTGNEYSGTVKVDESKSDTWWSVQFFHIMQNQEALPSNGYVKSYYLEISMYDGVSKQPLQLRSGDFLHFSVSESSSKETSVILNAVTIILLLALAAALGVYIYIIDHYQIRVGGAATSWEMAARADLGVCLYMHLHRVSKPLIRHPRPV